MVCMANNVDAVTRRALLVGINKYKPDDDSIEQAQKNVIKETAKASKVKKGAGGRGNWYNLDGTHNDVDAIKALITSKFGFDDNNVVVLKDEAATRERILSEFNSHLIDSASPGDVSFFFYAGHGSQITNSKGGEPDLKDETIVPADSYKGIEDIRDKELARLYNKAIDKGIELTVISDSCHSGSLSRGLGIVKIRRLEPVLDDIATPPDPGPKPEERGALLIFAAQDYQAAGEQKDENDYPHGVFSLALIRALQKVPVNEPAELVFLKAKALMQTEGRIQEPVIAGTPERRKKSLFGTESDDATGQLKVAVLRKEEDKLILQGGHALGLTINSELIKSENDDDKKPVRIQITDINGLNLSVAKVVNGNIADVSVGDLFEIDSWSPPDYANLSLWMPPPVKSLEEFEKISSEINKLSKSNNIIWVNDPTEILPTHIMSWDGSRWFISSNSGNTEKLGIAPKSDLVLKILNQMSSGEKPKFFIQLPPPRKLTDNLNKNTEYIKGGIEFTPSTQKAHYTLVGRIEDKGIQYSWIIPGLTKADEEKYNLTMPIRTDWILLENESKSITDATRTLEDYAIRLGKVRSWLQLSSPNNGCAYPYKLGLKNTKTGEIKMNRYGDVRNKGVSDEEYKTMVKGEQYNLILLADEEELKEWKKQTNCFQSRFVYVFGLDSNANRVLLFPIGGINVEHRIPYKTQSDDDYTKEISLGDQTIEITEPFGVDTYFLLTTEDAIPNPLVLNSEGVKSTILRGKSSPLQHLLSNIGTRGQYVKVPINWSIERLHLKSVSKK